MGRLRLRRQSGCWWADNENGWDGCDELTRGYGDGVSGCDGWMKRACAGSWAVCLGIDCA